MDLKKEIKVSDLFRRKAKPLTEDAPEERKSLLKREISFGRRSKPLPEDGPEERKSLLKREISLGRRSKAPKEPRAPKEPKVRRGRGREEAPALPQVPLMRAFNLLPREETRQVNVLRPSSAQIALAGLLVLVAAVLGSLFLMTSGQIAEKSDRYDERRIELAELNVPQEEPKSDSGSALAQEQQARTAALSAELGARVAWDRLLREFSLVLPGDVWLTNMTATDSGDPAVQGASGGSLQISGYTRRHESVAQLLARLEVLPDLDSPQLVSSSRTVIGSEEVVQFSISALINVPGAATA